MRFFSIQLMALMMIFFSLSAFAAGTSEGRCETKYPVVMAHGFLANEGMFGILDYFYGIEGALKKEGAEVCPRRSTAWTEPQPRRSLSVKRCSAFLLFPALQK